MEDSGRFTPLLPLASDRSIDKMDSHLQSAPPLRTPHAEALTRPRPEIILRWKRFLALVLLSAALISALTVTLWIGIPLKDVRPADAEAQVELFNSYSGVIMGFFESGVSQLLGYLFPVFIVYLHNLKWSRQDDPATRPISKVKKTVLLLFVPLVMVAIGNSLSAVQTNQSGGEDNQPPPSRRLAVVIQDAATITGALDATALRSVVRGIQGLDHISDKQSELARVASATRATLRFPLRKWSDDLVATSALEMDESPVVRIPWIQRGDHELALRATRTLSVETSKDLLLHGLTMLKQFAKGVEVTTTPVRSPSKTSTMSAVVDAAAGAFAAVGSVNASGLAVRLQRKKLHPSVQLESLTLEVPIVTAQDDSGLACGRSTCVGSSSDPLVRLRLLVAASRFAPDCNEQELAKCTAAQDAAFVFGSSVSATSTSVSSDIYTVSLTFAKLSWSLSNAALPICDDAATEDIQTTCDGLAFHLNRSQQHLILTSTLVPTAHLASPTQPLRLVQIVQPPVLRSNQLAAVALVHHAAAISQLSRSPAVDEFSAFMHTNQFILDDAAMTRTVDASALLFLFQNALVTPSASTVQVAWQRHLAAAATTKEFQVYIANTRFGFISTWIACAILFLLSALVLVLPNARARLEPPKGGNARAERFIAVQTEEVYPNLVYKKRFRIGKTGEKIKFREFAVEAVTLHHKMEEDEQIEL